jgi:hypothetical protein
MPLTIAECNAILNAVLPGASHASYSGNTSLFLSIHTGDPGDTGANEYTAYAGGVRLAITFGGAAARQGVSVVQVDFTGMGATSGTPITYFGLWTAASGGTFKGGATLITPRSTASGDTLRFPAGSVTILAA